MYASIAGLAAGPGVAPGPAVRGRWPRLLGHGHAPEVEPHHGRRPETLNRFTVRVHVVDVVRHDARDFAVDDGLELLIEPALLVLRRRRPRLVQDLVDARIRVVPGDRVPRPGAVVPGIDRGVDGRAAEEAVHVELGL